MNSPLTTSRSDLFGAFASGLCLIHCALTPLLFAARPMIDSAIDAHGYGHTHGPVFWWMFDFVFLGLSFIAVYFSTRQSGHKLYKTLLWLFFVVFAAGLLSELVHFEMGIWLMYTGSIGLVITHIKNYRFCKQCQLNNPEV